MASLSLGHRTQQPRDPAERQAAREEVEREVLHGVYAPRSERYQRQVAPRLERRADDRPGRFVEEARSYCDDLLADLRERGYGNPEAL